MGKDVAESTMTPANSLPDILMLKGSEIGEMRVVTQDTVHIGLTEGSCDKT
jgi:hypothetical protein